MASLLQIPLRDNPAYRQMTVEEFLDLELEGRAELDNGILYMMAGGSPLHAAVTANIIIALGNKLRGSPCRPMSSDMVVRTGPASLRMPDVSVYCGLQLPDLKGEARLDQDPTIIFEVLSPSTSKLDQEVKLNEYRNLAGVQAVVFVDHDAQRVRIVERTGQEAWSDRWLLKGAQVPLEALGVSLTADEIFALG